uniref:C6 domain-containing protein n=1 Tax=Plectus sambesii TaxID=2011161 RepID=A0A914XG47_9BILA
MVMWRAILFVGLCWLFIMVRSSEACHATFPEEDITEVPTTTVITSCSSATPLLNANLPSAGDHGVQVVPAGTTAVGATITVYCIQGTTPLIVGSIVRVLFDNGVTAVQNLDNYSTPSGTFFEQFTMTCTSSGLWDVSIFETLAPPLPNTPIGPRNGIVSSPGAIQCT